MNGAAPGLYPGAGQTVVVGAGLAGLITALRLAPMPVLLLSKAPLGTEASSVWAQGGLAASIGKDDSADLHLADTLTAGDGLCDPEIAGRILRDAPAAIEMLQHYGARFDRRADGAIDLGLEAAHSRRRIVHAAGDGSGREVMRALTEAARHAPSVTILEGMEALRVLVADGAVTGLLAAGPSGPIVFATDRVVLATGGIGGLFQDSTNPLGSFGQGLALAARAGAELSDLEFIQFHPTALDGPSRPMKLISEAVRGEGAVLVDETGRRFLADAPGAELGPRDVVARGVWRHLAEGHRVFLDAREKIGAEFARHFPAIAGFCAQAGIDPVTQLIPIRPAQHYHMGGVAVDGEGRSSVQGLWACGEVARTGLHGANRLASNSLIEAVVCGAWVADSIAGLTPRRAGLPEVTEVPELPDPAKVRPILSRAVGVLRDEEGLRQAVGSLLPMAGESDPAAIGLMMAVSALQREESRGAHTRTDFPKTQAVARRSVMRLEDAVAAARELDAPVR